jgi:hypothetical protein
MFSTYIFNNGGKEEDERQRLKKYNVKCENGSHSYTE